MHLIFKHFSPNIILDAKWVNELTRFMKMVGLYVSLIVGLYVRGGVSKWVTNGYKT
jgi:hypothetical protein